MNNPSFSLSDGTEILLHIGNPCDKACLAQAFDQLSVRSRHMRFFSPINRLSDAQLTYLTEVDGLNHVVMVAFINDTYHPQGIGIGRYIRNTQESEVAEFAITVSDQYQGCGVGSLLLDSLIDHARENHIRILRGYVLSENRPMVNMLKHRGAQCVEEEMSTLCCDLETLARSRS